MVGEDVSSEDLEELRELVVGFLGRYATRADSRRISATDEGIDDSVWQEMAEQLGLQAILIPESFDGAGFGPVEQAVALEEMGRSITTSPYLSSAVAATHVLLQSGDTAAQSLYLPDLASGSLRATVAFGEQTWSQGLARPTTTALAIGDDWLVSGAKRRVLDGSTAGLILVTAATLNGTSLFAVDAEDAGVTASGLPVVDLTRKLADITFDGARARLVGAEGAILPSLSRAVDLTIAGLAAEQVGAAAGALDLTVEYLKARVQFGRPLASFQAIKHRCADLLGEIEAARALAGAAVAAGAREDWDALSTLAGLAKARSWDVLARVSAECIQLHGGMGFTWEVDIQLYFKRAKGAQFLFGDLAEYRDRAARNLGITA